LSADQARQVLVELAGRHCESLASLSRMIGRNPAYLQQFVRRGTPRRLPEDERLALAQYFNISERLLGARDPWEPDVAEPEQVRAVTC
jgi:hypothetical protein